MGKQIAAIVDWYGPYNSLEDARSEARSDYGEGIYMLIGRKKNQKWTRIQYIGVAKDISTRLHNNHEKAKTLTQEIEIWLGEIASTGIPGLKQKKLNQQIDLVEWAHAYFLDLDCNCKKTVTPPDRPVTVINRWWKKDYTTPYWKRPHDEWPDVIDFKGITAGCNVGWLSKRKKWKPKDF